MRNVMHSSAIAVIALVASTACLRAVDYYVALSGTDTNTGTSWGTALRTITNAVAKATDGSTIQVSNGTHQITAQVLLDKAVTLRGFNGAEVTIIDCDVPGSTTPPIRITHPGAVLERLKITDCTELTYNNFGPINATDGTICNCILTANNCVSSGGGYVGGNAFLYSCIITGNVANHYNTGIGAGLRVGGGVVSNCYIAKNTAADGGGGIYMTGGVVKQCVISNNTAMRADGGGAKGGGVWVAGGRLENCLVITNRLTPLLNTDGGGIYQSAGQVVNCTVVENRRAQGDSGSGLAITGGSVTNCIFYYNSPQYPANSDENVKKTGGTVSFSCMQPVVTGTNNTDAPPDFVNRAARDYHLTFGSAAVDTGTNLAGIVTDLDSAPRPVDGDGDSVPIHDMGCFERAAGGSVFECNFSGTPRMATNMITTVFTANVVGPGTSTVTYCWDWTNDNTNELVGTEYRVVTNIYPQPGNYTVRLTCTNAVGTTATKTKSQYLKVWTTVAYVSYDGYNRAPYHTWDLAATSVVRAVREVAPGGAVWVSNGTYVVTAAINLDKAISIRGFYGASNTILSSTGPQIFVIDNPNVLIDGFKLRGSVMSYGYYGTIQMNAGGTVRNCIVYENNVGSCGGIGIRNAAALVEDCIISNNVASHQNTGFGGGVQVTAGLIRRCRISRNSANDGGGGLSVSGGTAEDCVIDGNWRNGGGSPRYGGGVHQTGGLVRNCRIERNAVIGTTSGGGSGVYMSGGRLRGCLVLNNSGTNEGGGIYLAAGVVENCTVVSNRARNGVSGGIYMTGGSVTNTIIWSNMAPAGVRNTGGTVSNYFCCCSPSLTAGVNGNIKVHPLFKYPATNDWRLTPDTPCYDKGWNAPWMTNVLDIGGNPRIIHRRVDIGAYETWPWPGATIVVR